VSTASKFHLHKMSWMEAEEAFRRTDTAIVPVGTLHAHGPIPIGIDARSVEALAEEVGKRTGVMVLPVVWYGENDKMKEYPGTITIEAETVKALYVDICRSLYRNGTRRVIFLNGHGGNHEPLLRAARAAREFGMLAAIVEWGVIEKALMPHLFTRGNFTSEFALAELAVAVAIDGVDIADLRDGGYKGEWGFDPIVKRPFGDRILPAGFSTFRYAGAPVTIPVDAWEIDEDSPPEIRKTDLEPLRRQGEETMARMTEYISAFVRDFQAVEIPSRLSST
jgi:creatinine amidohydrolase/Fe(II)-dependent formamide hydrolase-like protein